jgi:hypothetical protein
VRVVRAEVRMNPLLSPPDDTDRVYLKWNMLFSSAHCLRSNDPPHKSWSDGRNQPATFPRVTHLRIVSQAFPWVINIHARDKSAGVCCGEVIDGIAEYLEHLASKAEFQSLPVAKRHQVREAYNHNRARAHGVPGGVLGDGLRRLDWLCQETMFGGIERNDNLVRQQCGEVLPCTFAINCIHRYPLTEKEIQEQEQRMQAQRDRERERDARAQGTPGMAHGTPGMAPGMAPGMTPGQRQMSRSRSQSRSRHRARVESETEDDDEAAA